MDELEVKSLALDKPHFKSLAFKDTWNPYKILVSLSLRDRVKCGVLGWKGEGGQFRSLRDANILNLELFEKVQLYSYRRTNFHFSHNATSTKKDNFVFKSL